MVKGSPPSPLNVLLTRCRLSAWALTHGHHHLVDKEHPAGFPGIPGALQLAAPHDGHREDAEALVGAHTFPKLSGSVCFGAKPCSVVFVGETLSHLYLGIASRFLLSCCDRYREQKHLG